MLLLYDHRIHKWLNFCRQSDLVRNQGYLTNPLQKDVQCLSCQVKQRNSWRFTFKRRLWVEIAGCHEATYATYTTVSLPFPFQKCTVVLATRQGHILSTQQKLRVLLRSNGLTVLWLHCSSVQTAQPC